MIGLKDAEDYFKKGHIYLSSEQRSDLDEVLQFMQTSIKDALKKEDIGQASFWLEVFDDFLNGWLEREYKNPKITEYGKGWFRENVDLIKMVCAKAKDGMSRKFPLFLLIKYLPRLGRKGKGLTYEDLIDVYIFIFHTLCFPEIYSIYYADEPEKKHKTALRLALRGAYRYDAGWLLKKWLRDSYLIEFKNSLDEKTKEAYREILEKEGNAYIDIKNKRLNALLFLLFTGGFEVIRWGLFDDEKKDVVYEIFIKNEKELEDRFKTRINEITELEKERDVFSFELWGILRERIGEKLEGKKAKGMMEKDLNRFFNLFPFLPPKTSLKEF